MSYRIIYDAVIRKAQTTPPNDYIGNVEMAAGIGIVLYKNNRELDLENVREPEDIKEQFLKITEDIDGEKLDELCGIIVEKVNKYQVRKMVNETMEDLKVLVQSYGKNLEDV